MGGKICSAFEALGYKVNNRSGKENLFLNLMDLAAYIGYLILSIYNLSLKSTTKIGLAINFLMLARLFLKNTIELCKATKSKKNYGDFILIYTKIVVEIYTMVLLVAISIIFRAIASVPAYGSTFMNFYFGIILFITSLENILAFLERIYDAEPRVVRYAE